MRGDQPASEDDKMHAEPMSFAPTTAGRRAAKRAYARTTDQPDAAKAAAFDAASQKVASELATFSTHCEQAFARGENTADDALEGYKDAVDGLFSIPSPAGAALARKIELFAYPNHIDGLLSDPGVRRRVAEGDDDEEKRLLILYLDALSLGQIALPAPLYIVLNSGAADPAEWAEAYATYEAAIAEQERLWQAATDATKAVEAEAPIPEVLRALPGGERYTEAHIADDKSLDFDTRYAALQALREWRPRLEEARRRYEHDQKHEAWEEYSGRDAALERLIDTPAPTLRALTQKVRALLLEIHCDKIGQDIDTADTVAELLTSKEWQGAAPIVCLYQDLLRLTGQRPDLAAVEAFDVAGWVTRFEAIPGHELGPQGPCYIEPEAWPDGDHSKEPAGAHLWRDLQQWQRRTILDWARTHRRRH
jgi:hypothetical protein